MGLELSTYASTPLGIQALTPHLPLTIFESACAQIELRPILATLYSAMTNKARVVLFGGQGSSHIFSATASHRAVDDARQSTAGALFISSCHAAFLEDCLSIDIKLRNSINLNLADFHDPKDLLTPQQSLHANPIIQATTLCLYQLLHYLAELDRLDLNPTALTSQVLETTGICSGLLSAAVVATSDDITKFICHGVAAFRLAFWTAFRSARHSSAIEGVPETPTQWSLIVMGLSRDELEKKMELFQRQECRPAIKISAISSPTVLSITGPNSDLRVLQDWLGSAIPTRYAEIYAWYHGGEQLESVLENVLDDLEKHTIPFPTFYDLRAPLRSSSDGVLFDKDTSSSKGLARWVVQQMLINPVDWPKTSLGIISTLSRVIEGQEGSGPQIVSFGPSSESLFINLKTHSLSHRLEYQDLSIFKSSQASSSHHIQDDIAIVGMGIHFPKGHGEDELWDTLSRGLNAVAEIPNSRFEIARYHDASDSAKSRSMLTQHGAFLDDIWTFDNSFFNITPREAKSMDPQQRILLQTVQSALDDAGYVPDATPTFKRATIGCYIGVATGDYTDNLRDDIDVFYSPGTLRAFHSGRISFVHNFSGPSIVTDTACSSSLVSIYQACRSIQNGDCTAAVAGGVNAICSPDMYLGLSRGHFLSPKGGCKPFDAAADGYCRAEGCGVFVLKRLSDAIAENDQIRGVIKGVEVNQSGNAHSITHPHSETQVMLFQQLFEKSNVNPATVSVVEAHGTGTQAGDVREIASLQAVFRDSRPIGRPLLISSIKGNIGHCEAASGAAGLAKLLLMLRKGKVPKQAGLSKLNPKLNGLEDAGMLIPTENLEWRQSKSKPRRALLNNFGAAGSNVALLLEEGPHSQVVTTHDNRSSYVFNLSAKTRATLQAMMSKYLEFLNQSNTFPSLKAICYTATARRQIYDYRISFVCSSIDDLKAKLENEDCMRIVPNPPANSIVFMFSGQGSIYRGMSERLMDTSFFFKEQIGHCDKIVRGLGFPSFTGFLSGEQDVAEPPTNSVEMVTSQCAFFSLQYSLARLLMSWNIIPSYVTGHSLGEYAALAIAEALTLEDALRIVATRAQLIAEECPPNTSGMLACKTSPLEIEAILKTETLSLDIACRNSVSDCVVSGRLELLATFEEICNIRNIKAKRLHVPYGYHSSAMDSITESLKTLGRSIRWSKPVIPVGSGVLGRCLEMNDLTYDYFAMHARLPVRFSDVIGSINAAGGFREARLLEIGPHPTVSPLVNSILASNSGPTVPVLKKGQDAWLSIGSMLSQLFHTKGNINWREVFSGTEAVVTSLPGYPLQGQKFVVPFREGSESSVDQVVASDNTGFKLLPRLTSGLSTEEMVHFETTTRELGPLICGHDVGGTPICPASVYHEICLEAAQLILDLPKDCILVMSNMTFASPLTHRSPSDTKTVQVQLHRSDRSNSAEVEILVVENPGSKLTPCASTTVLGQHQNAIELRWLREAALVKRQALYFNTTRKHSTFQKKLLYENIFSRVVRYSEDYQTLTDLSVSSATLEGIGTFELPNNSYTDNCIISPAFTDTLLHTAGFIANLSIKPTEICICSHVEAIEILYKDIDPAQTFTIYSHLFEATKASFLADAIVTNSAGRTVAVARGMEFKRLQLTSFQRLLQSSTESVPGNMEPQKSLAVNAEESALAGEQTLVSSPNGYATPKTATNSHDIVKRTISSIFSIACGFAEEELDYSKSLDALGIDSLMQIEITYKLKQAFPQSSFADDTIAESETIQELEDKLLSQLASTTSGSFLEMRSPEETLGSTSSHRAPKLEQTVDVYEDFDSHAENNPIHLLGKSSSEKTLILCFHDGSGQVSMYKKLQDLDRDIYGFSDPDYANNKPSIRSLQDMAARYVALVPKFETQSLILCGWSFGGVLAYEVAAQLKSTGFDVKGLILIDAPFPCNHEPLPDEVIDYVLSGHRKIKNGITKTNTYLQTEFKRNACLLGNYSPPMIYSIKAVMLRSRDILDTEKLCGVRYDWLSNQAARDDAVKRWEEILGGAMDVLEIPGNHFQVFDQKFVVETSHQLRKACQLIDATV